MLRGCSQYYSRRVQGRSEDTHVGRRKEHRIVRYRAMNLVPDPLATHGLDIDERLAQSIG